MKYAGSSLDTDLRLLLSHFDGRFCAGTDHAECDHRAVRSRVEELSRRLPMEKVENVALPNIVGLVGLTV